MKKFIALFFVLTLPLITPTATLMGASDELKYLAPMEALSIALTHGAQDPRSHIAMRRVLLQVEPRLNHLIGPCSCVVPGSPDPSSLAHLVLLTHPTKDVYNRTTFIKIAQPGCPVEIDRVGICFQTISGKRVASPVHELLKYSISENIVFRLAHNINSVINAIINAKCDNLDRNDLVDTRPYVDQAVEAILNAAKESGNTVGFIGQVLQAAAIIDKDTGIPQMNIAKTVPTQEATQQMLEAWYLATLYVIRTAGLSDQEETATKHCFTFMKAIGTDIRAKEEWDRVSRDSASSTTTAGSDEDSRSTRLAGAGAGAGAGGESKAPKRPAPQNKKDDDSCCIQ